MQRLANDIHRTWVEPELNRRDAAGILANDLRIRRCLIRLPSGEDPIVEFNDEVSWIVTAKKATGVSFEKDEPVYLDQLLSIEDIEPPTHNGERVAFVFFFWNGVRWQIIFDFDPKRGAFNNNVNEVGIRWELGRSIAEYYNHILIEMAVGRHEAEATGISEIALWPAPAILPYPFTAICEHCADGSLGQARHLLVEHCDPKFVTDVVNSWNLVDAFTDRRDLFQEAMTAHHAGHYTLSVSALLPHVEGVVTDWMHQQLPSSDIPWRQRTKTAKFRDLIAVGAERTFVDKRIAETVIAFIIDGPVLDTFSDWLSPPAETFPNRNVVSHGRYDRTLYSEENSIKVFLMLDTLHRIMSTHKPE